MSETNIFFSPLLVAQVSKMGNKPHEELEEQLSIARQTLHKREEEVSQQ